MKSLPSNYNEVYFAVLPSIKQGLAYTDAYRDSVRQYMGNELMIYNSTNEQLNIEAGETSVIIRPHMACRFKMVFDNVQSGDLWLERIKWEWSTPFQF